MKISKDELLKIISGLENLEVEFKEEFTNNHKIAKELVAFSNTKGGLLVMGVTDEGEVKGIKDPKEIEQRIVNLCTNNCKPSITPNVEMIQVDGKDLFLVSVEKAKHLVITNIGISYIRKGSHSVIAEPHDITELVKFHGGETKILKSGKEYEILVCKFCKGRGVIKEFHKPSLFYNGKPCPVCRTLGKVKIPKSHVDCKFCNGGGVIKEFHKPSLFYNGKPCPACKGLGKVGF